MVPFPRGFLTHTREILGSEFDAFLCAMEQPPTRALRLNPLRDWHMPGETVPWEPQGRYVPEDFRPGQSLAHFGGAYYMQDPSAMAPARALAVRPGEVVLDLCAAPGGKSGQLAADLHGEGVLVCNEPEPARAKALAGNLERLGVSNGLVVSAYPEALSAKWPQTFDAILVDAPCSGEGMFRRDEPARAEWSEQSPEGCAKRQIQILREAAKMLKPGGRLCYSTCTFNQTENEGVIGAFLAEHQDFAPLPFALPGVGESSGGMLRLWPHRLRGEGHFVALFRRQAVDVPTPPAARSVRLRAAPSPERPLEMLRQAVPGDWIEAFSGWTVSAQGDLLCAVPPNMPDVQGIKWLRMGLHLCRVAESYVRPDHGLGMAISPGRTQCLQLSEPKAQAFARGESVDCPGELRGWTLCTCAGLPLGFGKAVSGTMKNHIPKGVRLR